MAVDTLVNNQISLIHGRAGTGKTLLSLGYLFSLLENGKIDKIIIFCNTIATRNSAKLGFYPGSRDEKLLDSQIGNLLISKLGSRVEVERLIEEETLILLPFSDIRGYDTSGMKAGVYISEAQNLDVTLMKLGLERIAKNADREVNRLDLEKIEFHNKVRQTFLDLAKRFPDRFVIIDASKSREQVAEDTLKAILERLCK